MGYVISLSVGFGVGLAEDGVVDGFVAAALDGVAAAAVVDDVDTLGSAGAVDPVGVTGVVADDPTAALSTETVLDPCDAHPAAPIATAPTAMSSAPPLPTPEVLIPLLTYEAGPALPRRPGALLEIPSNNGCANHVTGA